MRKITFSLFLLLFLFLLSPVSLAVPTQINFQGMLKDSSGNLVTGEVNMNFTIYDGDGATATNLWNETQNGITLEAGIYSVRLGSQTAITPEVFSGDTTYLEVAVNGQTLSPRIPLVSVPYAFKAEKAEGADDFTVEKKLVVKERVEVGGSGYSTVAIYGEGNGAGRSGVYGYGNGVGAVGVVGLSNGGYGGHFGGPYGILLDSIPADPLPTQEAGQIYFYRDEKKSPVGHLRYYDGTQWIQVDPMYITPQNNTYQVVESATGGISISLIMPSGNYLITAISGVINTTTAWSFAKIGIEQNSTSIFNFYHPVPGSGGGAFSYVLPVPIKTSGNLTVTSTQDLNRVSVQYITWQ